MEVRQELVSKLVAKLMVRDQHDYVQLASEGRCLHCGAEIVESAFLDQLAVLEYSDKGTCQRCQDKIEAACPEYTPGLRYAVTGNA